MNLKAQIKTLWAKPVVKYGALALGAVLLYKRITTGKFGLSDAPAFSVLTNPLPFGVLPNMPNSSIVFETPTASETGDASLLQAVGIG